MIPSEKLHEEVYGATFSRYTASEIEEFLLPFRERLLANGLDPARIFENGRVLDAGCGGGRGSLLALRGNADHVDAFDVSAANVMTTSRVLASGHTNFAVCQGTLADLPYEDDSFDFVWCNGVLMHTARPADALSEIVRVLKPSGSAWVYVYGRDGVYWRAIAMLRRLFQDVSSERLIAGLSTLDLPNGRIAEMIDDWKAPFLRAYAQDEWENAFSQLGCRSIRLMRGVDYDTCEQLARGGSPDLLGVGDLRFLISKDANVTGALSARTYVTLNESHLDTMTFPSLADPALEVRFQGALTEFEDRWCATPTSGIGPASQAQLFLRDVFLRHPTAPVLERFIDVLAPE